MGTSVSPCGWVCPQHECHGCGRAAADRSTPAAAAAAAKADTVGVLLRCVTCAKAFCDECSGGAEFEALDAHSG